MHVYTDLCQCLIFLINCFFYMRYTIYTNMLPCYAM